MVLVEQLEQPMVKELNGYISTTLTCSGLLFGALSAVADYMGTFFTVYFYIYNKTILYIIFKGMYGMVSVSYKNEFTLKKIHV